MRIALVIERFAPGTGGVENVAWEVAHGLARAGDEVRVVAREAVESPAVRVQRVRVPRVWQPLRVAAFARAVARAAPRGGAELVYSLARTPQQDVYRAGAGSHLHYMQHRYAGAGRRLRRVSPRHAVLLACERRVFRDASQWIQCTSERVRDELAERHGVARERTVLVRNGVDLRRYHPDLRRESGPRLRREIGAGARGVWLFAGSGFARKGLDIALRALARGGPADAELWVAGADPPAPWRRLAASLGVEGRVRFLGFRRDLPALYAAADALLLPTRYDAFANACLEAAAVGTPVITSGHNGAAEPLAGCGAIVSDPEDVAGFARALDALADPGTRVRAGEAARRAAEPLGWDGHIQALRTFLAHAAGSAPRPNPALGEPGELSWR